MQNISYMMRLVKIIWLFNILIIKYEFYQTYKTRTEFNKNGDKTEFFFYYEKKHDFNHVDENFIHFLLNGSVKFNI